MQLINERTQIRSVAKRWDYQYGGREYGDRSAITKKLMALDVEKATAADVEAIIGNDTWVTPLLECDECNGKFPELVCVGDNAAYESNSCCLCRNCLQMALNMVGG
jgi:hypothetical protein